MNFQVGGRLMNIRFARIHKDAMKPKKAHDGDACYDLFSTEEDFNLKADTRALIGTGIVLAIPEGFEGQVRPRSGNAIKKGLTILNSPGTIDSSYRGEVKVILYNSGTTAVKIRTGDKIAQIAFRKVYDFDLEEVESVDFLGYTYRGEDGFGSTDRGSE